MYLLKCFVMTNLVFNIYTYILSNAYALNTVEKLLLLHINLNVRRVRSNGQQSARWAQKKCVGMNCIFITQCPVT